MSLSGWMIAIGGVLQVGGLGFTGDGARRTWKEFRPDERLLQPVVNWFRRLWWPVYRIILKLLRKRPKDVFSHAGPATETSWAGPAFSRVGFPPLGPDKSVTEAIAELDERTRQIETWLLEDRNDVHRRLVEVNQRISTTEQELFTSTNQLQHTVRKLATGGVREIVLGLALSGVGVVLQTVFTLVIV